MLCIKKKHLVRLRRGRRRSLQGLANWHTEKSFKSMRLIKSAAFFIWSSLALGTVPLVSE